ncbi:serine hydrolase [Paraglaciecola sp.]|uniref:serine hydrolase domain-containing protein n=1 Tax=Paraglaciecola sp. TaxID=1920173 RepID=UPI00273FAE4B|nr:serine hydrolase [Paraglaciecola sp.]MDP5033252.1 beta-lactamase family protein [Paraglaciecola sp.]
MFKKVSIKGILLGFLLTLFVLLGLFHTNVWRLYKAITLYDADKIAHNFLNMYTMFDSSTIEASQSTYYFPVNYQALPYDFSVEGESIVVQDFLAQSATHAMMVIKDGEIVYEQYFLEDSPEKQHISFSVAKSFVSALFGIAIDEGHIKSIEDSVTDYVPELIGSGYEGVRIKDVLQMSSGVKFNEDYADYNSDINRFSRAIAFGTSLDSFTASLQREREPGTFHHYVSIDTQVLGMILVRATGVSLSEYLSQKIWQPMGMQDAAYWMKDSNDMELALGGLNITLRDYAKFGWLYLHKGQWLSARGRSLQIVPKQWVIDSVTPDAPHLMPGSDNPQSDSSYGYGYQWWIPPGAEDEFMAQGIYGQYIYVDPDQNLVIVKNSANPNYTDHSAQWGPKHLAMFRAISEHFVRAPEPIVPEIEERIPDLTPEVPAELLLELTPALAPQPSVDLSFEEVELDVSLLDSVEALSSKKEPLVSKETLQKQAQAIIEQGSSAHFESLDKPILEQEPEASVDESSTQTPETPTPE